MVAAGSLRGWSPRPGGTFNARQRCALQLMSQANSITQQHKPKRKRVVTYSSDSDSEDELFPPHHTPKRLCHKDASSKLDGEDPFGLNLWEERGLESSRYNNEQFFDSCHEEDITVEYARSSGEPIQDEVSDLSDISPTSLDDDIFEESSASSYEEGPDNDLFYERPDIRRFIEELPSLLKRRYRTSVLSQRSHWIDDEPLRIKFLNRQFKHRLHTGDFTDSQIQEVLEQRPIHGTYGDLNIPTPQVVPVRAESEEPEDLDLADFGLNALVERPLTPMPDSDSDESDSDSEGEPVYGSSQVSELLSRRDLESMEVYEEEEYEYESEDE